MDGIVEELRGLAVEVGELSLLEGNPRRGDVDAVARSLAEFGQRKPIVVHVSGEVIAGNHTLMAVQQLGWSHIAAVRVDDDPTRAKAFAIADNRTHDLGSYDEDDLLEMLTDVQELGSAELLASMSYSAEQIAEMLEVSGWVVPEFEPDFDQPQLDERSPIECPECGHSFVPR